MHAAGVEPPLTAGDGVAELYVDGWVLDPENELFLIQVNILKSILKVRTTGVLKIQNKLRVKDIFLDFCTKYIL